MGPMFVGMGVGCLIYVIYLIWRHKNERTQ